jgi:hypothetical protein
MVKTTIYESPHYTIFSPLDPNILLTLVFHPGDTQPFVARDALRLFICFAVAPELE